MERIKTNAISNMKEKTRLMKSKDKNTIHIANKYTELKGSGLIF
jgi:hypothetical protein